MSTNRVSIDSNGKQAYGSSYYPSISTNGRYVAYGSSAKNLVSGDTNGIWDIFVCDLVTRKNIRVSVNSEGLQAISGSSSNLGSYSPSISGDGRYVAYESDATNLVPGDTNFARDVFVYDTVTKKTTRVSKSSNGVEGNSRSYSTSISGDGRYIVYKSDATNLVEGDTNDYLDIFVYDTLTKKTTRVNVSSNGNQATNYSDSPSISASGRYVTYHSYATNLVEGDTNFCKDIFVYDTLTKKTTRVNVSNSGNQANSSSDSASISGDGRYVTYSSSATNLVEGDTNGISDIFVYDTLTKTTKRVSVTSKGLEANGDSNSPSISASGRYVTYQSSATNLVEGDSNGFTDIFVYDTVTKVTTRFNIATNGNQANNHSNSPVISGNESYVVYHSSATNLIEGDTNGTTDVFISDFNKKSQDILTFTQDRYTVTEDGNVVSAVTIIRNNPTNNIVSVTISIKNGGATFGSDYNKSFEAVTFALGQTIKNITLPIINDDVYEHNEDINVFLNNPTGGAFLGDLQGAKVTILDNDILKPGNTIRGSVSSNGIEGNNYSYYPSISGDGRYLTYMSLATNLVEGDTNGTSDIFVYDSLTKKTTRVSVNSNGIEGNSYSGLPSISGDGRYVAYLSEARNLVSGDTNGKSDIFVYDTLTKQTTRVSVNSNGNQANGITISPTISADGHYVAYCSYAQNLVSGDTNGKGDIFVYDTLTKQTTRVSVNSNGNEAIGNSVSPRISADGRYVAYQSDATNLVEGDSNGKPDIFVYDTLTKKTIRVSVSSNGAQGNDTSYLPTISADGRYVAYQSDANNLVERYNNGKSDIFLYDILTKKTTQVSVNNKGEQLNNYSGSPAISSNGRYVAYQSDATNLVEGDTNGKRDIFVYDTLTSQTTRVSRHLQNIIKIV